MGSFTSPQLTLPTATEDDANDIIIALIIFLRVFFQLSESLLSSLAFNPRSSILGVTWHENLKRDQIAMGVSVECVP